MIFALSWVWAGTLPLGLRPVAAPVDVQAQFAKQFPGRPAPVCTPLLPDHAALCFRLLEKARWRWVGEPDLKEWSSDVAALRLQTLERGRKHVRADIEVLYVEGMEPNPTSKYLRLRNGEGWVASALLAPEVLSERLGGGAFRVAIPRAGVLFAWPDPAVTKISPQQAAELDYILSVAVREAYDAADDAVSPMVHTWNGRAFEAFGQARPRKTEPPRRP